jgi:UDP-N-acetylglucosamine 2-epimerase
VNVMVVGERSDAVGQAVAEPEIRLVEPPAVEPDGDEVARIARALRAFEGALGEGAVDRVVVAGGSDEALAAVLVATKLRVPVANVDGRAAPAGEPIADLNAVLIAQLADAALSDDAIGIAAWLRESEAASRAANGH